MSFVKIALILKLASIALAAPKGCVPNYPPPPDYPPPTPTQSPCQSICADLINDCGSTTILFGGCFTHCPGQPFPTFTTPPCPTATVTGYPTPTPTETCPILCQDLINECGQEYGGCDPHCPGDPLPTYSKPPCTPTPTY